MIAGIDFSLLTVEIFTAALGLGLLIINLIVPGNQRSATGYLTVLGLLGILLVTLSYEGVEKTFMDGMYIIDPFATFFKRLFLVAAILVTISSLPFVKKLGYNEGDFFSLLVFATLGMMVLVSAGELITLYLGLELMTISFYILVSFKKKDAKSCEAGIKYIILSAMSSALLLYGLSLVYGLTKTTIIEQIASTLAAGTMQPLMALGIIFLLAGFGFKISLVPFHMWAPDVYEGAPTPITAFLAVASKAAALAAFVRIFLIGFPAYQEYWITLVIVLSVLTMVLGNLVAIPQTNIKRLLAYSSISQAGYLLLGIVAFSSMGIGAILFFSIIYVFTNVGAFMVVVALSTSTGSHKIEDYSGLYRRAPLLAVVMLFCLLSLAGLPPLAGFVGKLYLFIAVIEKGYIWLALLAVLMSMVSVYYYLLVVKVMFLKEPPQNSGIIKVPNGLQIAMVFSLILIIVLGIYPKPLSDLAMSVAHTFFPFSF